MSGTVDRSVRRTLENVEVWKDAEVLALMGKLARAERQANLWQKVATVQTGLYTLAVIAFGGHSLGWW